ncbi:MAG: acyl-CoA thioester hydrolase/BAAT C-terminal domain-containing protein [Bacteroidota bacterium]
MKNFLLLCFCILFLQAYPQTEKRKQYLEELKPFLEGSTGSWASKAWVSPIDSSWEAWQRRTGELPPNFDIIPTQVLPHDLMKDLLSGDKIENNSQWKGQKRVMTAVLKTWLTGTFPAKPSNIKAEVLESREEREIKIEQLRISWGNHPDLSIRASIYYPPGEGPFPVFMTPGANGHSWISISQALSRGYICVQYSGCDAEDDTEKYAQHYYPSYDFTAIMRRAWGAHRLVDYLYELEKVDKDKIGITGLSRDGKQVLMAAAFDERIDAVVVCSGGTGGEDLFRYTSPNYDNETIAAITGNFPNWLHPRLRFFAGREHKLPFDQHFLSALVAPRGLLLSSSYFEDQGNPWGIEQHYDAVLPVFSFLDAEKNLGLHLRRGLHRPAMRDVHTYVDFFDSVFGRGKKEVPVIRYYDYSFDKWKGISGKEERHIGEQKLISPNTLDNVSGFEAWKAELAEESRKLLGKAPMVLNPSFRAGLDYLDKVIRRPGLPKRAKAKELHIGQLQYPVDEAGNPLQDVPVVIYLHEFAYPTGYGKGSWRFVHALLDAGFAVYLQDQIGFGSRVEEGKDFYQRYPQYSKMGLMVDELSLAIDALEAEEMIDKQKIYAVGYGLGSKIGLWSAPFEDRIAAMALIAGINPLRNSGKDPERLGVEVYSHLHALLPALGLYAGKEEKLPIDYEALIASFAPKPLLMISPIWDWETNAGELALAIEKASTVYYLFEAGNKLEFRPLKDFNRFSKEMEGEVLDWLLKKAED